MAPTLLNLMVALGVGLLIGLVSERGKLALDTPSATGMRTCSIAALIGAVSMAAGGILLLAIATAGVGLLVAISYWRTLKEQGPGLTTELALIATVLIGGLAMAAPAIAGPAGVITAVLLAARAGLHRFAGSVLSDEEVRSALILAAAVVVVLPLLPNQAMGPFSALNPWKVWRLVVLVLLIGAAGHVATRLLGPRYGLPIAGLASGFVSSSATIGAMGGRAARKPAVLTAAAAGAVLSTVATVVQMAAVIGATSAPALEAMALPLVGAGIAAAGYGAVFTFVALKQPTDPGEAPGNPFSLSGAIMFALTLSAVLLVSAALSAWFGERGAILAAALSGFVDTHASAISIASLVASGRMTPADSVIPILAGFTANSVTKLILASTSGGRAFALRVVPGVLLVAIAAWAGLAAALRLG
jgi:uncharacterized membrane protein (DUF4010 family)